MKAVHVVPFLLGAILHAQVDAPKKTTVSLRYGVLNARTRLTFPYLKVPVGPEQPWAVAGRSEPVKFEVRRKELWMAGKPGGPFDTRIKKNKATTIELDAHAAGNDSVTAMFIPGDTSAGESPWHVVVCSVLRGRINGIRGSFIDHDADGDYLTSFRDLVVIAKKGPQLMAGHIQVRGKAIAIQASSDRQEIVWQEDSKFTAEDTFPFWPQVLRGLNRVNEIRSAMNLPPFALNRELSHDAFLHALYCAQNHVFAHEEEVGRPGYTEGGARAGMNSIGIGGSDVASGIDGFLSTLLHRMPLIDPTLTEIGIGADGATLWIEYRSGTKRPWIGQGPVIFPGPHHSWKLGRFAPEMPDPRPPGTGAVGLPITCAWYGEEDLEGLTGTLHQGRGQLNVWVHGGGKAELREMEGCPEVKLCLFPKRPLRYKSHRLVLEWTSDGRVRKFSYDFKIGKPR